MMCHKITYFIQNQFVSQNFYLKKNQRKISGVRHQIHATWLCICLAFEGQYGELSFSPNPRFFVHQLVGS